jgi:two-component system, NtrC family, sensor kinase
MNRRIRLPWLFAAAVLGPLVLVGLVVMWGGGLVVERAVQQRLEEDVALVARAIRAPLSRALAAGDAARLYEALESAFLIPGLYGASVYDGEGRLVAQVGMGGTEVGGMAESPAVGALEPEGEGEYGRAGGRPVYSYFVPLTTVGGRIEGLVQVTRRRSDIEASVRRVRVQAAGLFGVVWLLTAGLVLVTYHGAIGRRFVRLSAAMAGVERGRRDALVEESGPRELAEMARAFNRMVMGVDRAEREVDARREREAELHERLRRSEKLAAIGRLAAGVAHELGTPLAVVDGEAQRLARTSAAAGSAAAIRGEVRRMERIVRQLLEFGSARSGERQPLEAGAVMVSAAGAVRGEAEARGVSLDVTTPRIPVELRAASARLEAALVHLIRNGIQAAAPGGRVRVGVVVGDGVRFLVEDDGPGVPVDVRERLFEPFFTTKATGEGSGLGLAVVHAVAEEHGGRVEVGRSGLGGARFELTVPFGGDHE